MFTRFIASLPYPGGLLYHRVNLWRSDRDPDSYWMWVWTGSWWYPQVQRNQSDHSLPNLTPSPGPWPGRAAPAAEGSGHITGPRAPKDSSQNH